MTIPSSRSLIFEVKSTGSELAFGRLRQTSDVFGRLWTSSEDFGLLQESSEMIESSSKIPALPGWKSHAYISEKVGRHTLTLPWSADCTGRQVKHEVNHVPQRCSSSKTFCSAVRVADVKHSNSTTRKRRLFSGQTPYGVRFPKAHGLMFHFPAILTILGYAHVTHRDVTRHILILKKNLANYKILSSPPIFFFFFFTMQIFFFFTMQIFFLTIQMSRIMYS